jgi:predicted ATP-grasp superfamily ATP-dependent carboligase
LYGVSSSKEGRERLRSNGIDPITQGVVTGISGYLIAEGDRLDLDVTAILADCNPMYPDARAAALAIEAISELYDIDIPLSSLLEDARRIEDSVREVFENSQTMLPSPSETQDDPSVN